MRTVTTHALGGRMRRIRHLLTMTVLMMSVAVFTATSQSLHFTKYSGNPVLNPGIPGSWDDDWTEFLSVIHQDTQYVMWYSGANNSQGNYVSVGRATSPDGVVWHKDPAGPVLLPGTSGSWDARGAWVPKVIKKDGAYTMWYTGANAGATWQIGRAVSNDGVVWTKDSSGALLKPGNPGEWDETLVHTGSVLFDGSTYRMWYTGMTGGYVPGGSSAIGLATSPDGITWTKNAGNPVLTGGAPGSWDEHGVGECCVVYDTVTSLYHMLFDGNEVDFFTATSGIGHAYSLDGIHWTKDGANPVLPDGASGSWDYSAFAPYVVIEDSIFKMWYGGGSSTGYATAIRSPLGVAEHSVSETPIGYSLGQNYPNPFNPTTTIRYALPQRSFVTLTVFNVIGQQVATLLNGEVEAGYHEVRFNGAGLASGTYFYRMHAGLYVDTKKLLLVR